MAVAGGARVPLRVECAIYGIGGFSTTMHFMAMTIVPLWVVQLELSPFWLGLVLGCRPVLPLFFSIHVGALLDRMGARRVPREPYSAGYKACLPWCCSRMRAE